jgi:hypothetical protein
VDKAELKKTIDRLLKQLRFWLKRYPFHNIILLMFMAPLGYLFPLLFPLWAYYSTIALVNAVEAAPALGWPAVLDWWPVVLWALAMVVLVWVSYRLSRLRPKDPVGLTLNDALASELFGLIYELNEVKGQMPIHRIIVTERFELDIVKTRCCILPLWSRNTLVVGLPLMQMMPPNVYRAMLARKLCQHSLFRNPLLHWLHQLNSAWRQYHNCVSGRRAPDMQLVEMFYSAYSLLYAKILEPVARLDGLSADSYTLKVVNDEDVVESIEYLFVAGMFIEKMFWPKLREVARKQRNYKLFPFATLAKVGLSSLAKLDINAWLEKEMASGSSPRWGVASMPVRMAGLGHDKIYELKIVAESAADVYIGQSLAKVITAIDHYWQKNTIPAWQKLDDRLRREHALMATLAAKYKSRDYSFSELRQYLKLALRLRMVPAMKLLFKMFFLTRIRLFRKAPLVSA